MRSLNQKYRWVLFLLLLFCLTAVPAKAQSGLTVNVHWYDGVKCTCTAVLSQRVFKTDGTFTDTQVFTGSTDVNGHLTTTTSLDPAKLYWLTIHSDWYGIDVFSGGFQSGLFSPLPVQVVTFNLILTRPTLNGQILPGPGVPTGYSPPAIAPRTGFMVGL